MRRSTVLILPLQLVFLGLASVEVDGKRTGDHQEMSHYNASMQTHLLFLQLASSDYIFAKKYLFNNLRYIVKKNNFCQCSYITLGTQNQFFATEN